MTFKGDKIIGKPTLAMVEIHIAEKGLFCDAKECYDYWENKNWLTAKHVEPKTLETAIDSYNGIVVHRFVKKSAKTLGFSHYDKKEKKRAKNRLKKEISLHGNKGLENFIALENLGLKKRKQKKEDYVPYDEQLKDKRWEAFRKFVFAVRGKVCEHCGATTRLQVHHPKYIYGRKAWEYTCNEVMVLCGNCHKKIHSIK